MHIADKLKSLLGDFYPPTISVFKIMGIIVLIIIVTRIGRFGIKKVFEKQKKLKYGFNTKKADTMATLISSIFRYAVYIMGAVAIFSELTGLFDLKPVMAAAGIGGLVLGLGAQSLIKDILSGVFVVMEDQFVVGDLITVENMTGTVEEMELRVTKLRNFNGDLHIIPNGEIKKVTNHTRGNKAVIVDIPVAYSADINKAIEIANNICKVVTGEFDTITEEPKVQGITELGKNSMNLRIMAKTVANEQWDVERRIRKLIKEDFAREGIEFFDGNKILMEEKLQGGNSNGR
ncbi:MAG: mechanosensitive ion channel family protein [Clostridia bacterium]|nr:mechanosensitive ion channel family protein [Clostridia bacterium]